MENLDLIKLAENVVGDDRKVEFEGHKHLFTKIAFDVFQLNGSPVDSLWTLEAGEDGKQYLVALYDDQETEKKVSAGGFCALTDKTAQNITLFYKDTPIKRFASVDYGFDASDAHIFQNTLVEKLNSNKDFAQKLINSQKEEIKSHLLQKHPELA